MAARQVAACRRRCPSGPWPATGLLQSPISGSRRRRHGSSSKRWPPQPPQQHQHQQQQGGGRLAIGSPHEGTYSTDTQAACCCAAAHTVPMLPPCGGTNTDLAMGLCDYTGFLLHRFCLPELMPPVWCLVLLPCQADTDEVRTMIRTRSLVSYAAAQPVSLDTTQFTVGLLLSLQTPWPHSALHCCLHSNTPVACVRLSVSLWIVDLWYRVHACFQPSVRADALHSSMGHSLKPESSCITNQLLLLEVYEGSPQGQRTQSHQLQAYGTWRPPPKPCTAIRCVQQQCQLVALLRRLLTAVLPVRFASHESCLPQGCAVLPAGVRQNATTEAWCRGDQRSSVRQTCAGRPSRHSPAHPVAHTQPGAPSDGRCQGVQRLLDARWCQLA